MTRRKELLKIVCGDGKAEEAAVTNLIDEVVFLEEQMTALKKYPFILVSAQNPSFQKATPAAKQYKEFLQQYNNSLKLLLKISGGEEEQEAESPLRKWARENVDSRQ